MIHRDLKPENILLESAGSASGDAPPRVLLVDFGVAAFPSRDSGVGAARENAGTVHYMSPEQALGEADLDARSDIFSLGVLAYRMLAGRLPFDGTSATATIALICAGERVPLRSSAPGTPADLVAAVDRCLDPNPAGRWRRAGELRDALVLAAGTADVGQAPLSLALQRVRMASSRCPAAWKKLSHGSAAAHPVRGETAAGAAYPSRILRALSGLDDDARFAMRTLRKAPGFTAAIVLTLALGLSATTVVFSALEALILRDLPVADPGSLVVLNERRPGNQGSDFGATTFRYDRYLAYRDATTGVFTDLAAQRFTPLSVRIGEQALSVSGLITSGNYFELLGVRPALGHFYTTSEDRPGGGVPLAVVGYEFWRRSLGGDPDIIGQTLFVDSRPLTVVGVAPAGFNGAFAAAFAYDVWVPAAAYELPPPALADRGSSERNYEWMNLFGRLRPGVDVARASAELHVIGPRVPTVIPNAHVLDAWAAPVSPLPGELEKPIRGFMAMLLAVAVVVLLIAAANAAGMLLARATARRREIATRLAVGARRGRLVRQLLVESVVLCVLAGVVGLALSWWLTRALNAYQPPSPLPVAVDFGLDGTVLAVATATVLGTALLAGLAPALNATGIDLASAMKEGGLQGGVRRTRLRSTFVVSQVALSVVLLAVASLFVRSLQRTIDIDPGFEAAGVVHAGLNLQPHGYDQERAQLLLARLLDRLRSRAEIGDVALAHNPPLSGHTSTSTTTRDGYPNGTGIEAQWGTAGVRFIELLRTPLLAGRTFTNSDDTSAANVAVINETMAQRLWPGRSPAEVLGCELDAIGRRMTVVGVIGNGKYTLLQERARPFGYVPFGQDRGLSPMLYIRARGSTAAALHAARGEMAALDPNVALDRPTLLSEDVSRYLMPQQTGALLIGAFGMVGLMLAMSGLYGVLSYTVAQRQREFGVRIALGALTGDIVRPVVRGGLWLVAVGTALGLAGAFFAGRLISSFLFGLSPADPLTLIAVPLLLIVVAVVASTIPARRAAAADPMASLRAE